MLDRPHKLNAIDESMRRAMADALPELARTPEVYGLVIAAAPARMFSAGGDLVELMTQMDGDPATARHNLAQEYGLVWQLECFPKPIVSLIEGAVMGSGVGLTQFGTHRVAGTRYRWQMPETGIGFFPDVGAAYVLARLPHEIGTFLALTGRAVGPADALWLGLATHCIDAMHFEAITAAIADVQPIDPLLDGLHSDPGPPPLAAHAERIARCFGHNSMLDILARLADERGDGDWAAAVLSDLAQRSPRSLAVTLAQLRQVRALDIRQTLMLDYRIACRMLETPDLAAAVDAMMIAKTGRPRWHPASLEDVSSAMVERCLSAMPGAELELPTANEMQPGRR